MENKSKKFIRGSEEAKEFMANLRSKRGSKEKKPIETPSNSPDQKTKIKCKKNINVNFS